jgi:cytochrome c oxidase assembly factor CtaG
MPTPTNIWSHWNVDLWLLLPLLVVIALFVRGTSATNSRGITTMRWGAVAFAGGLLTLFVALISPLDALTQMLFSIHMVQYTLLAVLRRH